MTTTTSLVRNQTAALFILSYRWQKRQYCTILCNFVLPSILLIILSFVHRLVRTNHASSNFQNSQPRAFVPRPFDITFCSHLSNKHTDSLCNKDPFLPKYIVPIYSSPRASLVGTRASPGRNQSLSILESWSLNPFVHPPEDPNATTSSSSVSKARQQFLQLLRTKSSYDELLGVLSRQSNIVDELYGTRTIQKDSQSQFNSDIYNSWYKGIESSISTAVMFASVNRTEDNGLSLSVTVFYNQTEAKSKNRVHPLIANVARTYNAIYSHIKPGNTAMSFLKTLPIMPSEKALNSIYRAIPAFIGLLTHLLFPSLLKFLVLERVDGMRSMMFTMGLRRPIYWFGTYFSLLSQFLVSTVVLIVVGFAARIPFFTLNAPFAYIVLLFFWGNVLVSQAVLFAPFFKTPGTALTVGWLYVFLVNLIGSPFIISLIVDFESGAHVASLMGTGHLNHIRRAVVPSESKWAAAMILPSFALFRSLFFVSVFNADGHGVTVFPHQYRNVELGMCSGGNPFCHSLLFLFLQWLFSLVFGIYFDRILPTALDSPVHPLFFLGWKFEAIVNEEDLKDGEKEEDVKGEEKCAEAIVKKMTDEPFDGIVLHKLCKTYPGNPDVQALKKLSLVVRKNDVMCILAHNGAGKTTTFRTLIGELSATSGNAYISTHSIINDMERVHRNMGVTPQHDFLWDDLTVEEHLQFYGRLKDLRGCQLKEAVEKSLSSVELTKVSGRLTTKLSGGMKRRLSVSIALIGRPSVVILDEPSTGLDILAREKLWAAIKRVKQDRAIIMTTHSLEEAEALSSRVGIMSKGELKCIGTVDALKARHGKGHRVSISLPQCKVSEFHEAFTAVVPEVEIDTRMRGTLEYVLPKAFPIHRVFAFMSENREELAIRDWGINQTTLEDVFVKVTKDSAECEWQRDSSSWMSQESL